ncbi:hypothetical protein [Nonomuraea rosea]|uniref:hypothetical protein n=1 Tax=Nonomuraea rosea TaxID=638574 RepID=UPI0031E92E91
MIPLLFLHARACRTVSPPHRVADWGTPSGSREQAYDAAAKRPSDGSAVGAGRSRASAAH